jgi:hypothetical protein
MKIFFSKAIMFLARFIRSTIGIDGDTQLAVISVDPGVLVMVGDKYALTFIHNKYPNTIKFLNSDVFQEEGSFLLRSAKELFGEISVDSVGQTCLSIQSAYPIERIHKQSEILHVGHIILTVMQRKYEEQTAIEEQSIRLKPSA